MLNFCDFLKLPLNSLNLDPVALSAKLQLHAIRDQERVDKEFTVSQLAVNDSKTMCL